MDDAHDGAAVGFADLDLFGEIFDDLLGLVAGRAVERGDEDAAVVLDVDLLDAGIGDDLVDDLAAGSDDVFDLGGVDLDDDHSRRELREFLARFGDRLGELVDDEVAGLSRLRPSLRA